MAALFQDLAQIIEEGKKQVTIQINSTLTLVYWQVGHRINSELLRQERAAYGKEIVKQVATQLAEAFGRSFVLRNLRRMTQFTTAFPDFQKVSTQLSWSHFVESLPLKNEAERTYYAQKVGKEIRSIRELRRQMERKRLLE